MDGQLIITKNVLIADKSDYLTITIIGHVKLRQE